MKLQKKKFTNTWINHTTLSLYSSLLTIQLASWSHSLCFLPYIDILYSAICSNKMDYEEPMLARHNADRRTMKYLIFACRKIRENLLCQLSKETTYSTNYNSQPQIIELSTLRQWCFQINWSLHIITQRSICQREANRTAKTALLLLERN